MEQNAAGGTMWVPVCCARVMRHGKFPGPGGTVVAASLTCTVCGKHILLEPEAGSIQDYGSGSQVLSLVGSPHAVPSKSHAKSVDGAGPGDETMA